MKKTSRKIAFWGGVLALYVLLLAAVAVALIESGEIQGGKVAEAVTGLPSQHSNEPITVALGLRKGLSAILLPLGPQEQFLPGFPEIWGAYGDDLNGQSAGPSPGAVEGLQAVADIVDFSKGAVADLFLSQPPRQVLRSGKTFLVLSEEGRVQVIDCADPKQPQVAGVLGYQQVQSMALFDEVAFLLIRQPGETGDAMVIADLAAPLQLRELARLSMPQDAESFFISGNRLAVYTNPQNKTGLHFLHLYDVTDDYRLVALGSAESPPLNSGFLKFGDFLAVAGLRDGIDIYDVHLPLQPVMVASLEIGDRVKSLGRYGDNLFALGSRHRLYEIDVQDPQHPAVSKVVENARHGAYFSWDGAYTYFFGLDGTLKIFNGSPLDNAVLLRALPGRLAGTPVPERDRAGFVLLRDHDGAMPFGVVDVLHATGAGKAVDAVAWQGGLVVLDEDGLVRFYRKGTGALPDWQGEVQLPARQRWLAADQARLYVGGRSSVSIVEYARAGLVLAARMELPVEESWDALVTREHLCVAAGERGVWCFPLDARGYITAGAPLAIPLHLASRADVRQLATAGGGRVFAAAGEAGLLELLVSDRGEAQLHGLLGCDAPVNAVAAFAQFCLAGTATGVSVIDISDAGSLQNLGTIAMPGVTRMAVAPPDYWAGLVPGDGWYVLRSPRLLAKADYQRLQPAGTSSPAAGQSLYHVNLFDNRGVTAVRGVFASSSL